jgi:hypothetical protein
MISNENNGELSDILNKERNGGAPEGLLVPAPQKPGMNGGVFNFLYRSWQ